MFSLQQIKFKDILDIDKLEFEVNEVSCIVGPSGGGKTTLLKLLNNLISVDQGAIFYQGENIENLDPIGLRREVIMISQQPVTFTDTIREELKSAFKMTCTKVPDKKRLIKVLKQMQLEKDLDTRVELLSGGEKQRLALARSLLLKPEVLLLDEPSSALDVATEEKVIQQLIDYAKEHGITLIMVTHSLNIARQFGDKIVEIKKGKRVN
ncbi:MAG: ATP-binding cassette domain-containing protein [Bacillota bacterium]